MIWIVDIYELITHGMEKTIRFQNICQESKFRYKLYPVFVYVICETFSSCMPIGYTFQLSSSHEFSPPKNHYQAIKIFKRHQSISKLTIFSTSPLIFVGTKTRRLPYIRHRRWPPKTIPINPLATSKAYDV